MKRTNTQLLRNVLSEFMEENPQLADKLAETRLINAWGNVLGNMTMRYTTKLYIKNRILYVKLSSSVLRSELMMCREQLVKNLNQAAGRDVILDIVLS